MSLWRKRQVEESNGETRKIRNIPVPDSDVGSVDLLPSQNKHRTTTSEAQHLHSSGDKPGRNPGRT
jgi:hypothetical protein